MIIHEITDPNEDTYWEMLATFDARKTILFAAIADAVVVGLEYLIYQWPTNYTLLQMGGQVAAMLMGAIVTALILALPGWMIRGEYDLKPIFNGLVVLSLISIIFTGLILPISFNPTLGIVFKVIGALVLWCGSLIFMYALLMTTFPHSWAKGLLVAAVIFSAISTYGWGHSTFLLSRAQYMQQVFISASPHIGKVVAGKTVAVSQITDDLMSLEKDAAK